MIKFLERHEQCIADATEAAERLIAIAANVLQVHQTPSLALTFERGKKLLEIDLSQRRLLRGHIHVNSTDLETQATENVDLDLICPPIGEADVARMELLAHLLLA